jgi:hypothetical protein
MKSINMHGLQFVDKDNDLENFKYCLSSSFDLKLIMMILLP